LKNLWEAVGFAGYCMDARRLRSLKLSGTLILRRKDRFNTNIPKQGSIWVL
jgi:hypothetical protein